MSRFNTLGLAFILLAVSTNGLYAFGIKEVGSSLKSAASNLTTGASSIFSIPEGVKDVGRGIGNVAEGVAKQVPNLIPTPDGIFEASKNVLGGYPFELVSSAINTICSKVVAAETITPRVTPDLTKMNFQLRTACKNYSYPLLKANEIWHSPHFDPKKKVVILATGWTTTIENNSAIDTIGNAYNCRGDVNFVAVDAANFVDTLYIWSAFNTDEIGEHLAEGLVLLTDVVPVENIHLIGHSLGSHIVGAAGRYFSYKTGKILPRITGLDPAKPCFNEGQMLTGLMRGDAEFVDVIHSNSGVLGKRDPLGDADFYPGGLDPLPPGCFDVSCAHHRAVRYYAESVCPGNERNFMAKRCYSLTGLREEKCPGAEYPMGIDVPHSLNGNYFLEVNGDSPYGKNGKASTQCEKCCKSG
ncbi:PREDICTED: vitellogenin-1-like [Rhagoletis zephyria]|uniref:vitellogenin-1-like n=1 Tax=Rhagoletis zephyria TaxID=28612 RepID=UPI00081142B1|nr:PREDICTED: vitellogenin-1-like [Rhagoletis zephyria]